MSEISQSHGPFSIGAGEYGILLFIVIGGRPASIIAKILSYF